MRHMNGVYTQRFNRSHKRDGPLFRGRFKGILVQKNSYLAEVVRYIHWNPLKAGLAKSLRQFEWSSHKFYLNLNRSLRCLDTKPVLSLFSRNRRKAIQSYKKFLTEKICPELEKFYSSRKQASILGDQRFIDWIRETLLNSKASAAIEITEKRRLRGEGMIRSIIPEICRVFNVEEESLYSSTRGHLNIARQAALYLSKELSGLKLAEIGRVFKLKSYKTVATHCFRFQQALKTNRSLARKYLKLRGKCSQEET